MPHNLDLQGFLKRPFVYYFKRNRKHVFLGILFLILTNLLDVVPAYLIGKSIDSLTAGEGTRALVENVGLILLSVLLVTITRYGWRVFWGRFQHTTAADLQTKIYNKFSQLGPSYYQKNTVGELMSLITNDVNAFRMSIGPGVLILMDAVILGLIIPPIMMTISPSWTWKTLILLPLIPLMSRFILNGIHKSYGKQQKKFAELSGISQEIISGIRVIKTYAQEKIFYKRFEKYSQDFQLACNRTDFFDAFFDPMMGFGVASGAIILLFVAAPDVISGEVTVGAFFTFYQYIQKMVWPASALGMGMSWLERGRASFERITDLLNEPVDITDKGTNSQEEFKSLAIKGLTFRYPDAKQAALKNVELKINAGETIGILGPTGSGKTTIAELITRCFPLSEGQIFINEIPIEEIPLQNLRNIFSIVTQESFLFSDTVTKNIAFDLESPIEQVPDYARIVDLHGEVLKMDDSYETMLGERGVNLSGGQKQRLSIARSLIRNTPVLILDDALSAVDAKTEARILEELKTEISSNNNAQRTNIIISHRLTSLALADRIIILNDGEIEAIGTEEQLLQKSNTYKTFYSLQKEKQSEVSNV